MPDRLMKVNSPVAAAPHWPAGFRFAAGHCGIKAAAPDLLLVTMPHAAACAAVFTTNQLQAAPVRLSRAHLKASRGRVRALVVNSGNANCSTGKAGERAARQVAVTTAKLLDCAPHEVLVASTGVIGVPLDAGRITAALPAWTARHDTPEDAARAILTTDTRMKMASRCWTETGAGRQPGREFCVAGFAKGSGMIHPRMATMLGFLFTDVPLSPARLQACLRIAVEQSFHRITVDGDTSTNDMVSLIALPGAPRPALRPSGVARFQQALNEVAAELARQIVRDGEGAKRFVTVRVAGARNAADADRAARAIANSPLVKTAIAGADPNWGRVLAAAGYSGARFDPDRVEIWFAGLPVFRRGLALPFDEQLAKQRLDQPEVEIRLDLHAGVAATWMWTCDLTEGYIKINGSYRT